MIFLKKPQKTVISDQLSEKNMTNRFFSSGIWKANRKWAIPNDFSGKTISNHDFSLDFPKNNQEKRISH
jgi:hypothetical protein